MSIQAGWNNAMHSVAILGGAKKFLKGQAAQTEQRENIQSETVRQQQLRRLEESGQMREMEESMPTGAPEDPNEHAGNMGLEDVTLPTPEEIAAQRARAAAQAADSAPANSMEEISARIAEFSEMPGQAVASRIGSMVPPVPRRLPGGGK